jgi:HPr kinase/phosphorylase
MEQIHATCVSIDAAGVLIIGESGSGKSDLALRLIDGGADLVADDRVDLHADRNGIIAMPPPTLAGMFEVRGLGVFQMKYRGEVRLALAAEIVSPEDIDRFPPPTFCHFLERSVPLMRLNAFDSSAPAKVRFALAGIKGHISLAP